LSAAMNWLFC